MRKWLVITIMLISLQLILLNVTETNALTYNNIASIVSNKLPVEWSYVLNSYNDVIQSSISNCRSKLGSAKYLINNDSGTLLNSAVSSYLNLTSYMNMNNYTGVARSYGLLVCYVSALADPLRLVSNTTKDLINTYEYFVNNGDFIIVISSADSITDVRDYLKNFTMYSYNYFSVIYKKLISVSPGSNIEPIVHNVTQILLNRAATVIYSLMIKAINDHRIKVIPIGIAWIAVGIVIGIIIVKREKIFHQIRKSTE